MITLVLNSGYGSLKKLCFCVGDGDCDGGGGGDCNNDESLSKAPYPAKILRGTPTP